MSKFRGFYEFTDIVNSDEELMLQNLGEKIACAVRHNRIAIQLNTVVSHCACDFFQNFGTIKRILPGSSSPSHREGPGIEVGSLVTSRVSTEILQNNIPLQKLSKLEIRPGFHIS